MKIDLVIEKFCDLMIERMKAVGTDWKQPWVTSSFGGSPMNINGGHYSGMNDFFLLVNTMMNKFELPVYATIKQINKLGGRVNKGSKSFPVVFWKASYKIHEMAHSTGHESLLKRIGGGKYSQAEYAKEELVAELTAALCGSVLGFDACIRDDNAKYLEGWCKVLKKEPNFIVSVMSDVSKASKLILEKIGVGVEVKQEA